MTDEAFQAFVREELTAMKLEINVMAETIYQLLKLVKEDIKATQSTMCQLEKIVIGLVRNTILGQSPLHTSWGRVKVAVTCRKVACSAFGQSRYSLGKKHRFSSLSTRVFISPQTVMYLLLFSIVLCSIRASSGYTYS